MNVKLFKIMVEVSEQVFVDLERAWIVCQQMLLARGYVVVMADATERRIRAKRPDRQTSIDVFFDMHLKLNIASLKAYYETIISEHIAHAIIVYARALTPAVSAAIAGVVDFEIELFSFAALQFNILTHSLVPRHTLAPKEPGVDYSKYPVLRSDDPVAKFCGFRIGDLVCIERRDHTLTFRIVK